MINCSKGVPWHSLIQRNYYNMLKNKYIYIYVYICVYVLCICVYECVYVRIYVYVCFSVCIHTYIYLYIKKSLIFTGNRIGQK